MKAILLTLALLLPTTALANESEPVSLESVAKVCTGLGELAAKIMEARQAGVPLAEVLSLVDKSHYVIVFRAYDIDVMNLETNKKTVTQMFANQITVDCYRVISQNKGDQGY